MMQGSESALFRNRRNAVYVSNIAPDAYSHSPSQDHVLCRDSDGLPTAIYGEDVWDLNPYRLSATRMRVMDFGKWIDCDDNEFSAKLTGQAKYILYILIYFNSSGRSGGISASTLVQYWWLFKCMARFCVSTLDNDLARGLSIFDILSTSSYLLAFLSRSDIPANQVKQTAALLSVLNKIDERILGFSSCPRSVYNFERNEDRQHPVIPPRIYIEIISHYEALVEKIFPNREKIRSAIIELQDRNVGLSAGTLKLYGKSQRAVTMDVVVRRHGLTRLLTDEFPIEYMTRQSFGTWILRVQYLLKTLIHLYTGMRQEECLRMQYNCLQDKVVSDPVVDESGDIVDRPRMVSVISSTTKFSGYKRVTSWMAPDLVVKVIQILQEIASGLALLWGVKAEDCPLFASSSIIRSSKARFSVPVFENALARGADGVLSKSAFRITEEDLNSLQQTDPDRDFKSEEDFLVGNYWPLSSHQFRRSLAFYAANSGFVSLSTVSAQFKHTSRLMTQYYSRGHENLLSIFGVWDESLGKYIAPNSHVFQDFQMAVPIHAVNLLFKDIFSSDSTLMGGAGSYLEKTKKRLESGELSLLKAKKETIEMANKGEISYRRTLLGGCTKVGPCNDYMLGNMTACLACPGANIRDDMLRECIDRSKKEISAFDENSLEYQLAHEELVKLTTFHDKHSKKSGGGQC